MIAFAAVAFTPGSSVRSPAAMDAYFGGESLVGSWVWHGSWSSEYAPFAYRIAFKGLVDLTARVIKLWGSPADPIRQYWIALIVVSSLSFVFAGWALDYLVQLFVNDWQDRLAALMLWLALPSIHLAYHYPVQTKEDFLAYGLFFLGIRAVLLSRVFAATLLSLIGLMTRETLLLIPLLFLLSPTKRYAQRPIPLGIAVVTFTTVRLAIAATSYDPFAGFRENIGYPVQTIFAIFFIFGYGWAVILTRICSPASWSEPEVLGKSTQNKIFWRCYSVVLPMLIGAHFAFGRIVEIRISSLLAPWIVVGSLELLAESHLSETAFRLLPWAGSATLILVLFELTEKGSAIRRAVNPLIGQFAQSMWWMELETQLVLLAMAIGLVCWRYKALSKAR